MEWGLNNEIVALKFLEENKKIEIKKTGLWLELYGFLGISSDGLVGDIDVVGIKFNTNSEILYYRKR